jgi:aldehyde:ferredoxin oxidoreductase
MKFAGFDAFIITGRAPRPVYLWVNDGQVELREASHLWGKVTGEVEAAIKAELDDDRIEVAQAGPAAEKGVLFSAIVNMSNRTNGRTGMGAVMANKNLKAIAVRGKAGKQQFKIANPEALKELARRKDQAGSDRVRSRAG